MLFFKKIHNLTCFIGERYISVIIATLCMGALKTLSLTALLFTLNLQFRVNVRERHAHTSMCVFYILSFLVKSKHYQCIKLH